jgi:flagellar basal body-associated protein FliL
MRLNNNDHTNVPNLFKYDNKVGRDNKRKIVWILTIVLGLVIVALVAFLLFNHFSSKITNKPQPTQEEMAKEISNIKILTNTVETTEDADAYLNQVNELMKQTEDRDQRYSLLSTKTKLLTNSGRYQEAVDAYDEMLAMPEWSENQRFYLLRSAAEMYVYFLDAHMGAGIIE